MKNSGLRVMAVVLFALGITVTVAGLAAGQQSGDFSTLATKLVNQCAGIKEGDIVLVTGGIRDAKLLEDIAVNCRKLGAFPLISLSSEQKDRRYYDEVPSKYDAQSPALDLMLANNIAAIIGVDYYESPNVFVGVPVERIVATTKAYTPVTDTYLTRSVHQVYVGNNLYPTASAASVNGMTRNQLSKLFWDGINVDYAMLQATADKVKSALSAGREVTITNPNGTNLKVSIQGRPVFASDGVIGPDDVKRGGVSCAAYLPAGEVYLAPVPGTAEGQVVVDRQLFQGKEIRGLVLTFKAGKLVSMTAKSGLEPLQAIYDASDEGKSDFSFIDIGINPNVQLPSGSEMDAWMAAGMVAVGIGNNYWSGGDNRSTYSASHFLHGSTLKVDDKVLVDAGVLKL